MTPFKHTHLKYSHIFNDLGQKKTKSFSLSTCCGKLRIGIDTKLNTSRSHLSASNNLYIINTAYILRRIRGRNGPTSYGWKDRSRFTTEFNMVYHSKRLGRIYFVEFLFYDIFILLAKSVITSVIHLHNWTCTYLWSANWVPCTADHCASLHFLNDNGTVNFFRNKLMVKMKILQSTYLFFLYLWWWLESLILLYTNKYCIYLMINLR